MVDAKKKLRFSPFEDLMRRIVRSTVLGLLEPFGPEYLAVLVRERLTLAVFIKADPGRLDMFRGVARKVPKWAEAFTAEYVMDWIRGNRPDLAVLLDTAEGAEWMERNVAELRALVWSDDAGVLTPAEVELLHGLAERYAGMVPQEP